MDQYLRDLLKVVGIGGAFALLPALAALAGLSPPWPPAIGGVSALLILVFSLIVWEWVRKSRTAHRRAWILSALVLTLTGLFGYLILYSLFIEPVPGTDERVIRGFTCTPEEPVNTAATSKGCERKRSILRARATVSLSSSESSSMPRIAMMSCSAL